MTHYFIQPQYISKLNYYEIFAISNTRITENYLIGYQDNPGARTWYFNKAPVCFDILV